MLVIGVIVSAITPIIPVFMAVVKVKAIGCYVSWLKVFTLEL